MSTRMIEAVKISAMMISPFLLWFGIVQIKKSIEKLRFFRAMNEGVMETIGRVNYINDLIYEFSEVKNNPEIFERWNIDEFLEGDMFHIDADEYVSLYTESFGTGKEFHTIKGEEND